MSVSERAKIKHEQKLSYAFDGRHRFAARLNFPCVQSNRTHAHSRRSDYYFILFTELQNGKPIRPAAAAANLYRCRQHILPNVSIYLRVRRAAADPNNSHFV